MEAEELIVLAVKAREHAYAPYSGFKVGAALLTTGGRVFTGCNVENASYGLSNCAERTVLLKAVSEGERAFARLAIVAEMEGFLAPCGACRQLFQEFSPGLEVIMANTRGEYMRRTLEDLLPEAFGLPQS